jgi:hypothetical protein
LVHDDDGRSVAWTLPKLADYTRRTVALGRKVQGELAGLKAEYHRRAALVYSSVPMAYMDLENSEARMVELNSLIPAAEGRLAGLMNQRAALGELTALAETLGTTDLRLREVGPAD